MMIEISEKLETALKAQASAHGVSAASYVREVLERDLAGQLDEKRPAMGVELVAAMQASPFKEICLEPGSERTPVRDVAF